MKRILIAGLILSVASLVAAPPRAPEHGRGHQPPDRGQQARPQPPRQGPSDRGPQMRPQPPQQRPPNPGHQVRPRPPKKGPPPPVQTRTPPPPPVRKGPPPPPRRRGLLNFLFGG